MTTNELERIRCLFPEGSRVLCAVSGGADSVCLLHILASKREEWKINIMAAHYEHGIRGEESLRDCSFVQTLCQEWNVPLTVEHGNVLQIAKEQGRGIEETARELRYAFLFRTAEELCCDWIATAHNAEDNAETILMNLVRGAGTAGLRGIPPRRGKLIRPLLEIGRDEIEAYLRSHDISHVEDGSNASDEYTRNLLRHHVMPVLKQINPAFSKLAGNTSELLRRDEEYLDLEAKKFIDRFEDHHSLPLKEFRALHTAVASRVIRRMCPVTPDREAVDRVIAMAQEDETRCTDLPGIQIRLERGRIRFGERIGAPIGEYFLNREGETRISEAKVTISSEIVNFPEDVHNSFKTYFMKYENICGEILVTGRRDGDRIRPAGRNCTKTLKNLFLEAKLDAGQKNRVLVFRDDHGILAVPGFAIDQRCIPSPGDRVLKITIKEENKGE